MYPYLFPGNRQARVQLAWASPRVRWSNPIQSDIKVRVIAALPRLAVPQSGAGVGGAVAEICEPSEICE